MRYFSSLLSIHNRERCFIILCFLFPLFVRAQGDLLITPHRVVLEGNKQIEEIMVANIGPRYGILFHFIDRIPNG